MMIFSIGFTSGFYIPLFFISRILDESTIIGKIGNAFAILSVSTFLLGLLFKIQHYPGASVMLIIGALSIIFPTSILLLIAAFQNKNSMNSFLKQALLSAFGLIWIFFFGFVSFSGETIPQIMFIDEQLISTTNIIEENLTTIHRKLDKSDELNEYQSNKLKGITSKRKEICDFIKVIANDIVLKTGGRNLSEKTYGNWNVFGAKNTDIPSMKMIANGYGVELHTMLIQYDNLLKSFADRLRLKSSSQILRKVSSKKTWEIALFDHTPVFITLPLLTSIKNRVLINELETINYFQESN